MKTDARGRDAVKDALKSSSKRVAVRSSPGPTLELPGGETRRRRRRRRTLIVPWTIYRYLGVEILRIFIVSLLAMSLISTVVLAFQLTRSGIRLGFLWPILEKSLAYPLFFSLPIAILFSLTLGLGRLAGDLEIGAMKANGLSHRQIASPILLLATLITALSVYINGEVVPVIHYEKGNLRDAIIAQLEDLGQGRNRSLLLPGRVRLFVERYDGHRFRGIQLELPASLLRRLKENMADETPIPVPQSRGQPGTLTLFARQCELEISPDRQRIYLNLKGVEILAPQRVATHNQSDVFRQKYSISSLRLPLAFFEKGERVKDRSWKELFDYVDNLSERIASTRSSIDEVYSSLNSSNAPDSGELERERSFLMGELKTQRRRHHRAQTEVHRRAAFSLACFSFIFVGLPVVFLCERRSRLVPFFYCNVGVVLPFFLLVMLGALLGERGLFPGLALAIPNIFLFAVGAFLWSRVLKR